MLLMKRPRTLEEERSSKDQGTRTCIHFSRSLGLNLSFPVVSRTVVNCLFSCCIFTAISKQEQKISWHRNRDTEEPAGKTQCCPSPVYRLHITALKTEAMPLWTSPGMVKHQKMPRVQKSFYFPILSVVSWDGESAEALGNSHQYPSPGKISSGQDSLNSLKKKKKKESHIQASCSQTLCIYVFMYL